ncbi:hypothetical protein [Streptomyces niveus]|uniref:hypothetical protein n=1 Tax=Streptomyces niveus TaxID=193462 RepID=UPI00342578D7
MPLSGTLGAAEIGMAVMLVVGCNDIDPERDDRPPRPGDPLGAFLHGLLTMDDLFAAGGLRVTDTASGTVLLPGCCAGLEDWRGWLSLVDDDSRGSPPYLGHDPDPLAERVGDTVRLTVDAERDDSPVIELDVTDLRHLLTGVERDLYGFLSSATTWATRHLPRHHASPVVAALARAVDLPGPQSCGERAPRSQVP